MNLLFIVINVAVAKETCCVQDIDIHSYLLGAGRIKFRDFRDCKSAECCQTVCNKTNKCKYYVYKSSETTCKLYTEFKKAGNLAYEEGLTRCMGVKNDCLSKSRRTIF